MFEEKQSKNMIRMMSLLEQISANARILETQDPLDQVILLIYF